FGPDMRPGLSLDQLNGNAYPVAGLPHRALQDVADAELAPDLFHIDGLALVNEARIAGDHEEPADAAERGDDLFHHAVREIFLFRVAAHVGEGQHCNRRLFGKGKRRVLLRRGRYRLGAIGFFAKHDAVDAYWPCYVFDLLLAHIFECEVELVAHLIAHDPAGADSARLGQGFQPRCDIDTISVDIAPVLNDVANIDPPAEFEDAIRRHIGVSLGHFALHFNRATHRIDDAGKFEEKAVARSFDDATVMLLDLGVGPLAPEGLEPRKSSFLVSAH